MYQQQQQSGQFHAPNYRGDQPGHDQYLRSDSQQPSSSSISNSATSQYRGMQKSYQPTGMVPSFYNGIGQNNQIGNQQQSQQYQQFIPQTQYQNQQPNQFHLANYRGDQPGHDQYLRSDSQQPNIQSMSYQPQQQIQQPQNYAYQQQPQQSYQQAQYQAQQPSQFHMANYRGNQPGHDQYLRSDSQQPTN